MANALDGRTFTDKAGIGKILLGFTAHECDTTDWTDAEIVIELLTSAGISTQWTIGDGLERITNGQTEQTIEVSIPETQLQVLLGGATSVVDVCFKISIAPVGGHEISGHSKTAYEGKFKLKPFTCK